MPHPRHKTTNAPTIQRSFFTLHTASVIPWGQAGKGEEEEEAEQKAGKVRNRKPAAKEPSQAPAKRSGSTKRKEARGT